jgi:HrpA-like RNA helicase
MNLQVRFDSSRSRHTTVLFMTEGILLRRLAADPMLTDFDVIILDEVSLVR